MSRITIGRLQSIITAIAPAVLLFGYLYHPYIDNLTESAMVASAAHVDTMRWGLAHLIVGIGSGLVAIAFLAVRSELSQAGENLWSATALPFIILGSTMFAILPGMEFALLAAAKTGADPAAIQGTVEAINPWFIPVLLAGSIIFGLGALGFAIAIARSGVLSPGLTWLVVGALVVMAIARFVPLGIVLQYVGGVAGILALWPLARRMWSHANTLPAGQQQRTSAI